MDVYTCIYTCIPCTYTYLHPHVWTVYICGCTYQDMYIHVCTMYISRFVHKQMYSLAGWYSEVVCTIAFDISTCTLYITVYYGMLSGFHMTVGLPGAALFRIEDATALRMTVSGVGTSLQQDHLVLVVLDSNVYITPAHKTSRQ
jgi:hypothetical protein